ncbi:hypothetical protein RQP46_003469 [Phenoliferia psychrophenolica]
MPSIIPLVPVGINGFGRIGRAAFRASLDRSDIQVVAINHTAPSLSYLLHSIRYDSTHGTCRHADELSIDDGALLFHGRRIALFSERDPTKIDWAAVGAEYIVESTGKMLTVELAMQHVRSGAKKVVISAPSKDAKTIVVGVNRKDYTKDMHVISNASCTTNCLAPLAKHILDGYSKKSKRLGRGVASNIIPTTTGAATAVQLVLPELAGKFTGISIRVPVNNVSMVDLTVSLTRPAASKEALLAPLREASLHPRLGNIICVNDDELVSSDFLGFRQSCIIDSAATVMLNPTTAKIIAWYDNEWGYSVRILDLMVHMFHVDNDKVVENNST